MADKRPALGRGLSALIPEATVSAPSSGSFEVDIDLVAPNPMQPRAHPDETRLDELAASIRANGLLQPVLVRRTGTRFEVVAGERRWRAAQRAGLLKLPVIVGDVPDDKLLEVALVENIQREDLNPLEEARAYRRLMEELGLTQEAIAERVGKDRSSVANYVRLLKLPDEVRADIAAGSLSMGHARALLTLPDAQAQRRAAREVVARGLSVRDTEALVQHLARSGREDQPARPPLPDPNTRAAEERLRVALGTRVRIIRKGKRGRIQIEFASEDELHRLYEQLVGESR